jgi:ATP-dependent DNA helicase RecG
MNYDKIFMMDLTTLIEKLPRVGPKNLPRLKKLGIKTVRDLLWHFPARYEDYSNIIPIEDINEAGQIVSIRGTVESIENARAWKRRISITNAMISDDSSSIHAVWFNQPFIERSLPMGSMVSLAGKVALDKRGLYLSNPQYERIYDDDEESTHTGRLVPIYPETKGVTSKYLRFLIKPLISLADALPDPLPQDITKKYNFPDLEPALHAIHFPENIGQVETAKKRFAFEEILLFQLRVLRDRRQLQNLKAPQIKFDEGLIAGFVKKLPFQLTNDQRKASYEILQDLGQSFPMNRLLNGDVGSGKTIVALIAAYQAAASGFQVAFMAPTEILARQHFQTITEIVRGSDDSGKIKVGLLTGTEAKQWPVDEITEEKIGKKLMVQKIAAGDINILIGTHAVIQKNIKFKNLGLVVIDEQHRFGVQQRMKLVKSQVLVPHLLSMTATPIPRTLALTIYGDLDVSLLKEKPSGRRAILTKVVADNQRRSAYKFIEEQIKKGRQVFVVCPRIEVAGREPGQELTQAKLMWAEVKAVTDEYEKLSKKIFPHRRVAVIHGKMKAA